MLSLVSSGRFRKDVKWPEKRGNEMAKLKIAITRLASGEALPASYRDHPLHGDRHGFRDLPIEPDWLLIYRVVGAELQRARTGAHADLFDE